MFLNSGPGFTFEEATARVFGDTPDLARVIKARDLNGDGIVDIVVGTTYQTQSRLYLGHRAGRVPEVTATHLPQMPLSVGDLEPGDVDGDGDLDLVLADWGPGNNMTNDGGRTRLWLNDGAGRFTDATEERMPALKFASRGTSSLPTSTTTTTSTSSCRASAARAAACSATTAPACSPKTRARFRSTRTTTSSRRWTSTATASSILVTINDGDIAGDDQSSRREHVFKNDGKGRFLDATASWWPPAANVGEDDNMVAFLDVDADGDADFVIGSLSGPDRLLVNDGKGHLTPGSTSSTASPRQARSGWRLPISTATAGWTWCRARASTRPRCGAGVRRPRTATR